jgi:hypothetical protein
LGISYDQNYVDAFSSEDEAIDMIYTLILDNVNCLYESYNVLFIPIVHIKTNLNSSDRRELRISASNFWNKRVDACLRPDMVHHLTGIDGLAGVLSEAGGGKKALCGIGTSNSAICSDSEFSWDIFKAGVAIAYELGHHLGMSHENNQSSLMYENPVLQTCDNVLSSHNIHAALTALQSLILTEAPWQHQQALLTILGRWILTDSLTGADISTLSWIAGACPLYGGEAVYGARAALETVAGEAHYDDHALCQQVSQRSSGAPGVSTLTVAPNPASNGIRVSGSHIALVRFMTAAGSVVQEAQTGDVAEVEIDTNLLPPGIYLVSVTHGEANTTEIKKLIILR